MALLPPEAWACKQLDAYATRACVIALASEDDLDVGESNQADAARVVCDAIEQGMLSDACLSSIIEKVGGTLSMAVGRRLTTAALLKRVDVALTLARTLGRGLQGRNKEGRLSEQMANALANLHIVKSNLEASPKVSTVLKLVVREMVMVGG